MTARRLTSLAIAALVVLADQLSKWWILTIVMVPPRLIEVTPFLNLVLVWNRGISFGLLNTDSPWNAIVLTAIAVVISLFLLGWLWRTERWPLLVAIGLVVGGAIGNAIDRIRFGAVCDFVDVHAFGYHWPAFNVADAAITVGAALFIADSLFRPRASDEGKR